MLKEIRRPLAQENLSVKKDVKTVLEDFFTDMLKVECEKMYIF